MRTDDIIPPATAEKLATEFPKGTRHKAAIDIAVPLIGNGLPGSAVFQTLRAKFPADVSDRELQDVVTWAERQRPTPSTRGTGLVSYQNKPTLTLTRPVVVKTAQELASWWVSGAQEEPESLISRSPVRIPETPVECAQLAFGSLYRETDHINIVCKFIVDGEKARPTGAGKVMNRDGWVAWFSESGVPQSDAGGWMRLNPCAPTGTGAGGAITDADVMAFRYVLIESDTLPLPLQVALFSRLRLPIAVMVLSGASSVHAWVRVEAQTTDQYKEITSRLFAALKPFGVDQANSNPSRLCRLPGARRVIGAVGEGRQQLLWLNPTVAPLSDTDLVRFEESLRWPAIEDKPLRSIGQNAISRYETLFANRGKLGVPFGIPALDQISGGIKPGQTIVVAGMTGGGKSTFALHVILSALNAGYGVVLFSLEMDREEVFDQIVSNRCSVDRNKFNNGEFNERFDFPAMAKEMPALCKLPLYIEDNPLAGVNDIRLRILQLKADNRIHLAVVDYVQFVNPESTRENREQQVATISHALRALARETRIPIVVLSQLNDEGRLRESRVIAHNANVVMLIEVDGDSVTLKVVKGRGIPCGDYPMQFDRRFCRLICNEAN